MSSCFIPLVTFHALGIHEIGWLALIVLLLCCSALLSAAETSIFSLSHKEIKQLEDHPSRSGNVLLRLLAAPDYLLATILIANNLSNISVVILFNALIDACVDFKGSSSLEFVVKMGVVTFLLLFFGEIIPKIFATYNPMKMAKLMAQPLSFLKKIFKPFSYPLIRLSSKISDRASRSRLNISMDELSDAIEMTSNQSDEERKILIGIVDFVNTDVAQIMKHRVNIVALDSTEGYNKVKEVIIGSGFSRIPIYQESIDHIIGVLYIKDLIPYISRGDDFQWQNLSHKPFFVPEHKKINDLLEEFQEQQNHLAIVVDEYGSVRGLVTLEDILEEIVGEISDESDKDESFFTSLGENVYLFDGKTHLGDMLRVLDLAESYLDAYKGQAESVAGLMLEIRKQFLKPGDEVRVRELILQVDSIEEHRIEKVKVTLRQMRSSSDSKEKQTPHKKAK